LSLREALLELGDRLRRPGYFGALLAVYLPYAAFNVAGEAGTGTLAHLPGWLSVALTPLIYFGGIILISPLPWQWGEERATRSWILPARGLLFAEAYMGGMVLLDAAFRRWAGGPPVPLGGVLLSHATYHAPVMALVGGVLAHRERLGREHAEARAAAREAQGRALQNQLNPHVLFNALNGLAELVTKSPEEAERSIRHLSDLLRKVLAASEQDRSRLGEERDLLEDYLNMERLRLGHRLALHWDWDRDLDRIWLPPLLLQPLVENAIKHGIATSKGGGQLHIEARREGPEVVLAVRNTGRPLEEGVAREGVGLRNLRARLGLHFAGTASLSVRPEAGWTVAEIRLRDGEPAEVQP